MSPRIPSAVYRLQLNGEFTFADASNLVGYLHQLGVSDVYISPLAKARAGSRHCYDVTDHRCVNPELGGEEAFREFASKLRERGIGLLVDTVPNHVSIGVSSNAWWFDVLENGPSSSYAAYFDIDWRPPKEDLADKVLLPVLGDQYGRVLENRELLVIRQGGAFAVTYYDTIFPLAPRSWTTILDPAVSALEQEMGESSPDTLELASIVTALRHLPLRTDTDPSKLRERQREKEIVKGRLAALVERSQVARLAIEKSLLDLNGVKGVAHSFDRLEELLDDQAYRLSFWSVASDEINYRRFFDINDLIAIRVELPEVFAAVHELTLRLIRDGLITGLRIDHIDGLRDPQRYLDQLQAECAQAQAENGRRIAADDGPSEYKKTDHPKPFYIVVEKILGSGEPLRKEWPVYGTTGYEFLNDLNGLFIESRAHTQFENCYARFSELRRDFREVVYEAKRLILRTSMAGEQNMLARRLDRISEQHRWSRDFTLNSLGRALAEMVACFPVYRSYVSSTGIVSQEDRRQILRATFFAKRKNPELSESTFDFIASVLLLAHPDEIDPTARDERLEFTLRFQQLTGPVMAKGFEDTALYRYYPLASLNEVGHDPATFGISVETFHERNLRRLSHWPHGLSATTTHDTKRGEDVRARINVLSEIPGAWDAALDRWHQMNEAVRIEVEGVPVPDGNEEYLLYQTLIGAWPLISMSPAEHQRFVRRIQEYMHKAVREAKVRTSWVSPNHQHDQGLLQFIRGILQPDLGNQFLVDFLKFRRPIAVAGMLNSLSQTVLKICSPGVADIYQGTELWDDSLVDPDNRRAVDFVSRRGALDDLVFSSNSGSGELLEELLSDPRDGRIKMYIIRKALCMRRTHPELFSEGNYVPLSTSGERAHHVVAFARSGDGDQVITVAGRFFMSLNPELSSFPDAQVWSDTTLALPLQIAPESQHYLNLFTGRIIESQPYGSTQRLSIAEVFAPIPIAMLVPAA